MNWLHDTTKIGFPQVLTMRRVLKKEAKLVEKGLIPYSVVETSFKKWMDNSISVMSMKKRKDLIALYESLFNKTILVSNNRLIIFD